MFAMPPSGADICPKVAPRYEYSDSDPGAAPGV